MNSRDMLLGAITVLILFNVHKPLAAARISTGLRPTSDPATAAYAVRQRSLRQTNAGWTADSPALPDTGPSSKPSPAPPETSGTFVPAPPASTAPIDSSATPNATTSPSSPAAEDTKPPSAGTAAGSPGDSRGAAGAGDTGSGPASSTDGCQYIKGLQFEGQISAYDEGFKFTQETVNNLNHFIGLVGTYWEVQAAASPQACCQLCKTSRQTHAAAVAAAVQSGTDNETLPLNGNRMRDPCLYFTWVPVAGASGSATQQQKPVAAEPTAPATYSPAVGEPPAVVATDRPVDAGRRLLAVDSQGTQNGACLLVGDGFSWVDAEASDFKAVSGLLYSD